MMIKEIVLATHNADKRAEMADLLNDLGMTVRTLAEFPQAPDVIEDGETCEANAIKKARTIADYTGLVAVADDTGLEINALGGRPGVYAARYAGPNVTYEDNWKKLLRELQGVPLQERGARFVTVVAIARPRTDQVETVEGVLNGLIADRSFETTATPATRRLAFDYEERDTRCKRRSAVYERFEHFRLRFLLVDLRNGRLDDGHVAGRFGARGLRRCEFDTTFVSSVQVLGDGGDEAAFHLHITLAVKKRRK